MSAQADVAFHTGVPDKLGYACRLLRKAWRSGARVVVTGMEDDLAKLDRALWVFQADEFVPHLMLAGDGSAPPPLRRTPIWLCANPSAEVDAKVLVNLGPGFADDYRRFERVIELVSTDEADAQAARTRWRRFVADGVAPVNRPVRNDTPAVPT